MPSNSPTHKPENNPGTLYVVATPIGHREDITLRALKVLKSVELVAAEDTRKTGRFLKSHEIYTHLISYQEHNESQRTPSLIKRLNAGESIALVTSAGTPAVSDPGYRLIHTARRSGISVVPIPGVSAAVAALSVSGLPTDSFAFIGFPAKKSQRRTKQLESLALDQRTLIFYESPKRVVKLIEALISILGDRQAFLAREMTKQHEEFISGRLTDLHHTLANRSEIKGECTLLVSGFSEEAPASIDLARAELKDQLKTGDLPLSTLVKKIARIYGIPKNELYNEAIKMQAALKEGNHDEPIA
jgi:16S rRNA (cytidine1402-2'-O)-methyltransferase